MKNIFGNSSILENKLYIIPNYHILTHCVVLQLLYIKSLKLKGYPPLPPLLRKERERESERVPHSKFMWTLNHEINEYFIVNP